MNDATVNQIINVLQTENATLRARVKALEGALVQVDPLSPGPRHDWWGYRCQRHGTRPIRWGEPESTYGPCTIGSDDGYPPWSDGCPKMLTLVGPINPATMKSPAPTFCEEDCLVCFPISALSADIDTPPEEE